MVHEESDKSTIQFYEERLTAVPRLVQFVYSLGVSTHISAGDGRYA